MVQSWASWMALSAGHRARNVTGLVPVRPRAHQSVMEAEESDPSHPRTRFCWESTSAKASTSAPGSKRSPGGQVRQELAVHLQQLQYVAPGERPSERPRCGRRPDPAEQPGTERRAAAHPCHRCCPRRRLSRPPGRNLELRVHPVRSAYADVLRCQAVQACPPSQVPGSAACPPRRLPTYQPCSRVALLRDVAAAALVVVGTCRTPWMEAGLV